MTYKYLVQVTVPDTVRLFDPELARLAIEVASGNALADCTAGAVPHVSVLREETPTPPQEVPCTMSLCS